MSCAGARASLAALLLVLPAAADASVARCRVRVKVEPSVALVGQQVLYDLRILRRDDVEDVDWERAPSFPAFRSEWLPGLSEDAPTHVEGAPYRVYHERRALFPAHPGPTEVPGASLRCRSPAGEEIIEIPTARIEVREPPGGAGTLIGPVELSASLSPDTITLGESFRVSLVLRGEHNVWQGEIQWAEPLPPDLEVFERPGELAKDAGGRLRLRRYATYDLVPRRAGRLVVPPLVVSFYDPASATRGERRTEAFAVEVREPSIADVRGDENEASPGEPSGAPEPGAEGAGPGPGAGLAAVALLAALGAGGVVLFWRRRRGPRGRGAADAARGLSLARELHEAGDRSRGLRLASDALRTALAQAHPEVSNPEALSVAEWRDRADAPARPLARALVALERARFDPQSPPPDWDALARAIRGEGGGSQ